MTSKQFVEALYRSGISEIRPYVTLNWITAEDYQEITGEKYEEVL